MPCKHSQVNELTSMTMDELQLAEREAQFEVDRLMEKKGIR